MPDLEPSRHPERAVHDRAALDALLDRGRVAHVALSTQDGPLVLPTAYARLRDRLVVHGSPRSRWLAQVAAGAPVCVAVSEVSAIVVGRSAPAVSMRYASATLFGAFAPLPDDEKADALAALADRLTPGGAARLRPATERDVARTGRAADRAQSQAARGRARRGPLARRARRLTPHGAGGRRRADRPAGGPYPSRSCR